jgi:hypothetical protein
VAGRGPRHRESPADDLGAALARHIVRDHLAGDGGGRHSLVPQRDRHVAQCQEVAGELPHRLGARAVAAAEAQRQADDKAGHVVPIDQGEQRRHVFGETAAADRVERAGDDEPGIGEREPDCLGPDIEPHDPPAGRHRRAKLLGVGEEHPRS